MTVESLDPRKKTIREQLRNLHGTRTGTFTFNGVTYTDMNEVEWRLDHWDWTTDIDAAPDA